MRVAASIGAPDVNVLVACVHSKIAGFAIMRYGDDDAHLDLLAVAPPYRRAGIGRRLLEWLEKCAVVAGAWAIARSFTFPATTKVLRRRFAWSEICRAGLWTREFRGHNTKLSGAV